MSTCARGVDGLENGSGTNLEVLIVQKPKLKQQLDRIRKRKNDRHSTENLITSALPYANARFTLAISPAPTSRATATPVYERLKEKRCAVYLRIGRIWVALLSARPGRTLAPRTCRPLSMRSIRTLPSAQLFLRPLLRTTSPFHKKPVLQFFNDLLATAISKKR